jgi:hypothetical protein
MSYTPTNWATGDVITAAALNKLEQGVASAGGVTVVPVVYGSMDEPSVIQMAASELFAACQNGIVFIKEARTTGTDSGVFCDSISNAGFIGGAYSFNAGGEIYSAESANDYPSSSGGR